MAFMNKNLNQSNYREDRNLTSKAEKINQHLSTKWNIINSINMLTFSNILYAK